MTTPPTPAGWYPDPDGTGGQRYWDGTAWTEHQAPTQQPPAPAPPAEEPTSSWPSELPPWPTDMEMPSWDKAASEQPTSVVEVPQAEPAPPVDPAPAEPAPEPAAANHEQQTVEVPRPEPDTTVVPTYTPPPTEAPAAPDAPGAPAAGAGNLLKGYLAAVGVLLLALIAVLVYAFGIHKPDAEQLSLPGTTSSEPSTAETTTTPSEPAPAEAPVAGEAVDGDVTFTTDGIDIGPTVVAADNDQLTKTATGEFVVVHLTLTNNGQTPAAFVADQQVLTAGGQTFTPDTEATFYLGGTSTVVYPGEPAKVSIAFDVPPGTVPESLQVHGDLSSAGAVLPLS